MYRYQLRNHENEAVVKIPCPTPNCPRMMDPRSRTCADCNRAVQKRTFVIPKRRGIVAPYYEQQKRMKKFRSM
jgi:hypothetical protein